MKLDYDELRRIYRLEKNTSKLVELPEDFYNSLNEFVGSEKKKYLSSLKDLSASKAKDFTNLKKMLEEFFGIRQKKLLNQALIALHTGEFEDAKLALQEKELFKTLISVLQKHQALFEEIFANNVSESREKKDLNFVRVKILRTVPAFMGSDMKEYGPFSESQASSLPYKVAKLLIAKNLAELEEVE